MKSFDLTIKLAKCYYRGSLHFCLQNSDVEKMTLEWQQQFLDITVNSELIKKYPLSTPFNQIFFKLLIDNLRNKEIHEGMYVHLCQAMGNPCNNSFYYRHYVLGNNLADIITLKETNKMVVDGTTGLRTWEAAMVLADWAYYNKDLITGKKVLELGSGVGFTGVAIAKLCAPKSLYLTDCHPRVLKTLCDNIKINFPEMQDTEEETIYTNNDQTIGAMILDWTDIENISSSIVPDIVVGSDIVYDPTIIQPLCEVLKAFFERNAQLNVYIASVIRNEETFDAFRDSLRAMNLRYKRLPLNLMGYFDCNSDVQKCILQINC